MTASEIDEDQLLAERQTAKADGKDDRPEQQAAAKDAPIDRLQLDLVEADQHGAGERDGRNREPQQEHRLIAVKLREPARQPRHRQDAGP